MQGVGIEGLHTGIFQTPCWDRIKVFMTPHRDAGGWNRGTPHRDVEDQNRGTSQGRRGIRIEVLHTGM